MKTEEEETKEIKEEKNQGKKEDEGEIEAEIKKKPKRVAKTEAANQISKDDLLQRFFVFLLRLILSVLFYRYEDYLIKWHRITNLETKKGEIKFFFFFLR